MTAEEVRRTTSFCRICPTFCGIVVETVGEQVVRVTGDARHPISHGYTCSKGRAAPDMHDHPARLDVPLVRGADGTLVPAPWDEVLDDIAARFAAIVEQHGPQAVASYAGSNGYDSSGLAAHALFAALGMTNTFSALTIDAASKWMAIELMMGARVPGPLCPDYRAAEVLLLVGHNPLVSHGHTHAIDDPVVALRDLRSRGGTLIVVDPRRTETARMADVHIALRPGTDAAFLACLVKEALARRADDDFLTAAADPTSLALLADAVAPYTRDRAASLCDIDRLALDRACDAICGAPRVAVGSGTGASMSAAGNAIEWLCISLLAVTGSLDRRGGSIFSPGMSNRLETRPAPPDIPYEDRFEATATGRVVPRILRGLPCAVLPDEILAGSIRALFVVGGNPAVVFPDSTKTCRALAALDLLVVTDIRHTDTTELATHVLPTTSQFERADLNLSYFSPDPFAQFTPAVLEPGAERRPLWSIHAELGRRLGVEVPGGAATDDEEFLRSTMSPRSRIPFDVVRAAEHGIVDESAPEPGWLVPALLARPIDLAPRPILEQFLRWDWDAALPADGELLLVCRRLPRQVNSFLRDVETQARRAPHPTLLIHPDDAARRHIADGDVVDVATTHGALEAVAEVTDAIRAGAVSVTHGWASPNVNLLTSDADVDAITLMPRFTGFPVTVTRGAPDAVAAWR